MLRAQIVGATGYGGLGMVELILGHPDSAISSVVARDDAGRRLDHIFPHLTGRCDLIVESVDDAHIGDGCDIVVFATPDGVAQVHATALHARGVRFLDYSGDFRFASPEEYARYAARHPSIAGEGHQAAALLRESVYGIAELHRDAIANTRIVGNPGCFAVGIVLGLAPLFQDGLIASGHVHVDGLTGSSGAGKRPSAVQHFSHLNDNVIPYRILSHQQVVEAERTLGQLGEASGADVDFVPHLLGVTRGIRNTRNTRLTRPTPRDALLDRYRTFYAGHPFVRILDDAPTLNGTVGSNYGDVSLFTSGGDRRVVVVTALDNLLKGQSGQAMQNLNLDVRAGRDRRPPPRPPLPLAPARGTITRREPGDACRGPGITSRVSNHCILWGTMISRVRSLSGGRAPIGPTCRASLRPV